ncbi:MAG: hypothetical protein K2W95_14415 [Candidatus Obscuribacterales bacterium]|nr:hypothetical protein [Candidatus Obscuribacterales bacterium]
MSQKRKFTELDWTEISRYNGVIGVFNLIILAFLIISLRVEQMTPVIAQPTVEYCKITSQTISSLIGINQMLLVVLMSSFCCIGSLNIRLAKFENNPQSGEEKF